MKKILLISLLFLLLAGCSSQQQNDVTVQSDNLPGFNVSNFAQLLKTTSNPSDLEKAINLPGNNINNLDLNNDGNIDYLKVKEVVQNQIQVVDDVSSTQSVTVATLTITPNQNTANVNIQGNQTYCGANNNYQSSFSLTDLLIVSYLMRPHTYYSTPYSYGYHPAYYHVTRTRVPTYTSSNNTSGRVPVSDRKSLSDPNQSQRSFQSRDNSKPVATGGFGSKTPSSTRSFGSSHSSFGHHK